MPSPFWILPSESWSPSPVSSFLYLKFRSVCGLISYSRLDTPQAGQVPFSSEFPVPVKDTVRARGREVGSGKICCLGFLAELKEIWVQHLEGSAMVVPFTIPNPKPFGSNFALATEEMTRETSSSKNQCKKWNHKSTRRKHGRVSD